MSRDREAEQRQRVEWLKCQMSAGYFIHNYVRIYNATLRDWVAFDLWPAQQEVLGDLAQQRLLVILKARQIGLTWLCLGWALYQMLFRPAATVLLFSRRDDEAMELLSDDRLRGMYKRLPGWMQARSVTSENSHEWNLSNNSRAMAFPTSAGDSYTGSMVLIDEADLIPNFNQVMRSVKPTVDNGGQMILLSRADKSKPLSEFKQLYRSAKQPGSEWRGIFLPWSAHPGRSTDWYAEQKAEILARTGGLDDLFEQYPATEEEALQPQQKDKRLPAEWLKACYVEQQPLPNPPHGEGTVGRVRAAPTGFPPQLVIFVLPVPGRRYVVGVDCAEGNPTSDDSAISVVDAVSGEECTLLHGKFQPAITGSHALAIAKFYNGGGILVERNNHGHAVLLWLLENGGRQYVLKGHDRREGWLDSPAGKVWLYDALAQELQQNSLTIHSLETFMQLASIEGRSLRAPVGQHDDIADAFALANRGRSLGSQTQAGGY